MDHNCRQPVRHVTSISILWDCPTLWWTHPIDQLLKYNGKPTEPCWIEFNQVKPCCRGASEKGPLDILLKMFFFLLLMWTWKMEATSSVVNQSVWRCKNSLLTHYKMRCKPCTTVCRIPENFKTTAHLIVINILSRS